MKNKVLIIEDDPFLVKIFKTGMEKENLEVITASQGEEGLNKVRRNKPDIVVLDLIIPEKTGFEVLKELKSDDKLKNIPIIVLSNLGQDVDIERIKEAGADEYFVKNEIKIKQLNEKIKFYLNRKNRKINYV